MKVSMLGWEYPPHISGGLGTACEGLSRALARLKVAIRFVVPHLYGDEDASHMALVNSYLRQEKLPGGEMKNIEHSESITIDRVPAFLSPYWTPEDYSKHIQILRSSHCEKIAGVGGSQMIYDRALAIVNEHTQSDCYGGDIFSEVSRYMSNVLAIAADDHSDVIHSHDWMTYPAGIALANLTGKPLVVHVHSLEYDRSGANVNPQIHAIERAGVTRADKVIAVSHYTAQVIHREHGVPMEKISVVHNGVYPTEVVRSYKHTASDDDEKIVLFLGRITFQKGPDYFVEAAAKVIPHVPNVVFVMAGSGDMLHRMIERVAELGIEDHFRFPGFLRGQELEQALSIADLYVMPSVSEPFGISALEAVSFDTPVIISRQSGVSEVLGHALKVDFWDVDRLADLIINGLIHEELRLDMVGMAREEVKKLRWDASATKTLEIYNGVIS